MQPKPIMLIILDGWGYRKEKAYNAIATANTPNWDQLWKNYPHILLSGSGHDVGLPQGQMGNSEVGHLHIGAGRLLPQILVRINDAISSGEFYQNPVFNQALKKLKPNKALHIMGLLSPGGVHSHENHIYAMIELAAKQGLKQIYVHAFLDGRDTPPQSAKPSLQSLQSKLDELGVGQIASIVGRYYAMDRDKRWERTAEAYALVTEGKAPFSAKSAVEALEMAYERSETDEFVKPTTIQPAGQPINMSDGDVAIFMNYRADRARQLSHALSDPQFNSFHRDYFPKLADFVTLTEYATDIKAEVAYPVSALPNIFGEVVSKAGLHQLRIAETEKYAHVTFFFNGGREKPYPHEDRILIPSPKVATYDLKPSMSAAEVTDRLVEAILSKKYGTIICNFANPDMVGHTGNIDAAIKAIETIDCCLGRIYSALEETGGETLITADHGNAECMYDPDTKQPYTAHTTNPVPLLYVGRKAEFVQQHGFLFDIAPTLLYLLGLDIPKEMTGKNLLRIKP